MSPRSIETVLQFASGIKWQERDREMSRALALKNVCLFIMYSGAWIKRNAHCIFKKASYAEYFINRVVYYS